MFGLLVDDHGDLVLLLNHPRTIFPVRVSDMFSHFRVSNSTRRILRAADPHLVNPSRLRLRNVIFFCSIYIYVPVISTGYNLIFTSTEYFSEILLSSYTAEDKTESWFRQCWIVCVSQRAPLCKKSTQMYHWWKTRIKLTIMVMIIARLCFIYSQIESLNQCTYDYIITIKKNLCKRW